MSSPKRWLQFPATANTQFCALVQLYSGLPACAARKGISHFGRALGEEAWPSVMVEVGYPGGMKFLRLDAEWWLLNSQDKTRFVILLKWERDPFALHIESWMMVETGRRRTRHTPSRIPSCVQDFDINAAGQVTSRTGSTKLEIHYDAIFDVRDPVSPPPETISFSFAELSGFAVRLFEDLR